MLEILQKPVDPEGRTKSTSQVKSEMLSILYRGEILETTVRVIRITLSEYDMSKLVDF